MAVRVHDLAKEFGLSNKEMLDKLAALDIPAKTHATPLSDAHVEEVRKALAPQVKAQAGDLEDPAAKELAEQKKAEEEAARRAAVEAERAAREAERAKREGEPKKDDASAKKQAPKAASAFQSLEEQIEAEKERVAREKEEARQRARAAAIAKEVAKKQAVEDQLRNRGSKKAATPAKQAPKPAPVMGAKKSAFSSLLSQIESEQQRIEAQKAEKKNERAAGNGAKRNAADAKPARGAGKKKGKKGPNTIEPDVPELQGAGEPAEDRYAQMAVQAEKLQRDKVLAEARAAVAAASTHENEGRRKSRKKKREAEKREKLVQVAEERGIDAALLLDDSVVEIPQGATVAKFAELLGVAPNDVIKRLFMLGQMMT
ncbi:MAG: translation initiation factor IF-2 N-terminal domain-containing protein, partial [Coriobacteriia bacterium]|nr:translation initiation factor IF-2 N-terminal domain-containing protein [Coriobacteriia bacterium]